MEQIGRKFVLRLGIDKWKSRRFPVGKRGNGANLGKDEGSFFVKFLCLLRGKEFRVVATGRGNSIQCPFGLGDTQSGVNVYQGKLSGLQRWNRKLHHEKDRSGH